MASIAENLTHTEEPKPVEPELSLTSKRMTFFSRVLKYTLARLGTLGLMLVIGVFLAVVVLNFGGYIDQIHRARISEAMVGVGFSMRGSSLEEIQAAQAELQQALTKAYGLDQPFLLRCMRWTYEVLTLNLGSTGAMHQYGYTVTISVAKSILLEHLPYTLLLFGVSNLLFFFASFFLALLLYRHHEGFLDRLIIFISPISSIPNWIYGVFLVIVFAALLHVLPFPHSFTNQLHIYVQQTPLNLLKYMLLPVTAIFLNMFFQTTYSWRTFFLLQAGEDYLELAKAKGLPNRVVERRYLVRPSLPYILTTFAMMMVGIWQSSFVLEKFFFWPGIGSLFFNSIGNFPITAGVIVLFAYMLAITIFILEIAYAMVDPRVRMGSGQVLGKVARKEKLSLRQRREARREGFAIRAAARDQADTWKAARDQQNRPPVPRRQGTLTTTFREIRRYPSAVVGLVIIAILVAVSIYTVIAYPYRQTLALWSGEGGIWDNNPRFAQPVWSNLFRSKKLPTTIVVNSQAEGVNKVDEVVSGEMRKITLTFPFDYPFRGFPQELVINVHAMYSQKAPMVNLTWITPDGRDVKLDTFIATSSSRYSFEWANRYSAASIINQTTGPLPWYQLFGLPGGDKETATPGAYQVKVEGYVFEPQADMDAEMVLYGEVYGLAGTDNLRRDLKLAVLWGTPFSLVFGLLGAFGTGVLAMLIAATSIWFGGWVDTLIQRITEINMLLPALPMAIMIYFLYTKSIWIILAVIILLSVFGNALKNYRAAFMQVKESGYVQAAQVYGASNIRIITRYLVPRIIPLLVPQLVALVPSYIFLEPTLAFLGVTDPSLPTWGKVLMTGLYTAQEGDQIYYMTLMREPYLALQPIFLMFVTGLAFSLLGIALDRIFNPRLRSV